MSKVIILLLACFTIGALAQFENYNKAKVYTIHVTRLNAEKFKVWLMLRERDLFLDVWKKSTKPGGHTTFLVRPEHQKKVERELKKLDIHSHVLIDDLEESLSKKNSTDSEFANRASLRRKGTGFNPNIVVEKYLSVKEIDNYLKEMVKRAQVNGLKASIEAVGKSYLGETLELIRLRKNDDKPKQQVMIDAGIHAREHHSISLALYILNELVMNKGADSKLFDTYEFLILPVVNPDGYQYSMTDDIMWRKNRRPLGNGTCYGVDNNRNYDVSWLPDDVSESTIPCEQDYRGPAPFSEPETQTVKNVLINNKIKFYLTIHTYGNAIFYPYSYKHEEPKNIKNIKAVADLACDHAKNQLNTTFQCGPLHQLYIVHGGGIDYAYDAGAPYSYAIELGPDATGFQVPLDQLETNVKNGWQLARVMLLKAAELGFKIPTY